MLNSVIFQGFVFSLPGKALSIGFCPCERWEKGFQRKISPDRTHPVCRVCAGRMISGHTPVRTTLLSPSAFPSQPPCGAISREQEQWALILAASSGTHAGSQLFIAYSNPGNHPIFYRAFSAQHWIDTSARCVYICAWKTGGRRRSVSRSADWSVVGDAGLFLPLMARAVRIAAGSTGWNLIGRLR